ncbi:MAG: hypothetical protein AAF827_00380 [Cyanobacteria bacterium P01_D01_bin.6]
MAGLESYFGYNLFLKIILFLPIAIYSSLSSFFILALGAASIIAYVPFLIIKAGNLLLDTIIDEIEKKSGQFNFFEILLCLPVFLYILDLIALLILAIPGFLGLADYLDFPGYMKGFLVNSGIVICAMTSFFDFNIFAKIIALPVILVTLILALISFAIDLLGVVFTFIPWCFFLAGDYFINLGLDMSQPERYQSNFLTLSLFPLIIYILYTLAIILLVAPVILGPILIAAFS